MSLSLRPVLMGAFAAALLAALAGGGWQLLRRPPVPLTEEVLPLPPESPRLDDSPEYLRCLDQIPDDPQGALAFAEAWQDRAGTSNGSRHCQALALLALGDGERAAPRLEALAAQTGFNNTARAVLYGQAGQAWMAIGDAGRAYAATTLGLALAPDTADLLVDRALASGSLGRYADSLADATRATELDPDRPDAWVFRAAALRHLDRPQEALHAIDRALTIASDNAEALLERGILRQLNGDLDGAREDWESVIQSAPESAAADLAQQNLALSEAGPKRR
ncbi:MAG: hypothetical protein DI532_14595 [Azospirillum brasilense]|nr:MAG: hypothetical protein DI532_14595 [Azospirillum brasilense]